MKYLLIDVNGFSDKSLEEIAIAVLNAKDSKGRRILTSPLSIAFTVPLTQVVGKNEISFSTITV